MFDRIGEKLKIVAVISLILDVIACIALAIVCFVNELVLAGILLLILGPVAFYILSLFILGFAKIIENTDRISFNTDIMISQNKKDVVKPEIKTAFSSLFKKKENTNTCPYCGKENKEDAKFCTGCGKNLKEESEEKPAIEEKKPREVKTVAAKAWFCKCGQPNLMEDKKCIRCKTSISKGRVPANTFPGIKIWRCSCGKMNSSVDFVCASCGKAKE